MTERRTWRRFTAEFKTQAVRRVLDGGKGPTEAATGLDVSTGQLSTYFLRVLLGGLDAAVPFTLALTLRGDFYGRMLEEWALADRLQDVVVNVGTMRREELARAVLESVVQMGHRFEDGLVHEFLGDGGAEPGGLRLLAFLLKKLWDRRERSGPLDHAAYRRTDGVERAIAGRVQAKFKQLSAERQAAARRFLVRLITLGEGSEDACARRAILAGDPTVCAMVERFAQVRPLTIGHDPASGPKLMEVGDEALTREWDTLRRWVDHDRELLHTVERVKAAQWHWKERGRSADLLLPPGWPLEEMRELLAQPEAAIKDIQALAKAEGAQQAVKRRRLDEGRRWEVEAAERVAKEQRRRAEATLAHFATQLQKSFSCQSKIELIDIAISRCLEKGLICEFGVYKAESINYIANRLPNRPIFGFDSFEGLPEYWRPAFGLGAFDLRGRMPQVQPNVTLVKGWFDTTLPAFVAKHAGPVALLHIDCDLYSSTNSIFKYFGNRLVPGSIIVFDEFFNYPGWEKHEFRAFSEFAAVQGLRYEYLAYNSQNEQVIVRVND